MDGIYAVSEISRIIAPILENMALAEPICLALTPVGTPCLRVILICVLTAGRYGVCLGSADFTAI